MQSAFVCTPVSISSRRTGLLPAISLRPNHLQFAAGTCFRRRSPPTNILASGGWPAAREVLSTLEPLMAEGGRPGIYFAEPPKLSVDDLLKIVRAETPDEWVNEIVRMFLGWRQLENGEWNDDLVEDRWKTVYKSGPPNFIGKAGEYSPEIDRPVKLAVQNLSRSVPPEGKQLLKPTLSPFGFNGWKIQELTPNLTRRAQCVNFILYWYKSHYPEYEWEHGNAENETHNASLGTM